MQAREVGEQEFWELVGHGPDKTFEPNTPFDTRDRLEAMDDKAFGELVEEVHEGADILRAQEAVQSMRLEAGRRLWLWQGTDVEQASRIFRLRFGREPGGWRSHAEDKTVPEGHLMFDLTAVIE